MLKLSKCLPYKSSLKHKNGIPLYVYHNFDTLINCPQFNFLRFIEMPMRRHIQDQESPRVRESTNLSSLSLNNPSLASQLSLRERKKRRANTVGLGYIIWSRIWCIYVILQA